MHLIVRELGDKFSEGTRLLWQAATRERMTLAALARAVRRGEGTVSRWLHGQRRPDEDSRRVLHDRFGIPADISVWRQKPTRKFAIPPRHVAHGAHAARPVNGSA